MPRPRPGPAYRGSRVEGVTWRCTSPPCRFAACFNHPLLPHGNPMDASSATTSTDTGASDVTTTEDAGIENDIATLLEKAGVTDETETGTDGGETDQADQDADLDESLGLDDDEADAGFEDVSGFFDEAEVPELPQGLEGKHVLIPNFCTEAGTKTLTALVVVTGLGHPYLLRYRNTPEARAMITTLVEQAKTAISKGTDVTIDMSGLGEVSSGGVEIGEITPWNGRAISTDRCVVTQLDGTPALYPTSLISEIAGNAGGPVMIMMPSDDLGGAYRVNGIGRLAFGKYFFGLVSRTVDLKNRAQNPNPALARRLYNALALYVAKAYPAEIAARKVEDAVQLKALKGVGSLGDAIVSEIKHRTQVQTTDTAASVAAGVSDFAAFEA